MLTEEAAASERTRRGGATDEDANGRDEAARRTKMRTDEYANRGGGHDGRVCQRRRRRHFCWVVYLGFSYLQLCPSYTFSIFWFIFRKYYCKKLKKNNFTNFDGF